MEKDKNLKSEIYRPTKTTCPFLFTRDERWHPWRDGRFNNARSQQLVKLDFQVGSYRVTNLSVRLSKYFKSRVYLKSFFFSWLELEWAIFPIFLVYLPPPLVEYCALGPNSTGCRSCSYWWKRYYSSITDGAGCIPVCSAHIFRRVKGGNNPLNLGFDTKLSLAP